MVKHTQTICRQQPTNCYSVFDHFVGLALKELRLILVFRKLKRCAREHTSFENNQVRRFLKFRILSTLRPNVRDLSRPAIQNLYSLIHAKYFEVQKSKLFRIN